MVCLDRKAKRIAQRKSSGAGSSLNPTTGTSSSGNKWRAEDEDCWEELLEHILAELKVPSAVRMDTSKVEFAILLNFLVRQFVASMKNTSSGSTSATGSRADGISMRH